MKKDVIYFQHDFNARRDAKIISLIDDYGYEGYGRFWALVEILREQEGYIPYNKTNLRALAFELRMDSECLKEFISALINEYELLILENEEIYSKRLLSSIDHLEGIRKKRKDAAEKRWNKKKIEEQDDQENKSDASVSNCNANVMQTDAKNSKQKDSIEKERIVKDSIGNKNYDSDNNVSHCFALWNKPNPNLAEVQSTEKLLNEFTMEKVKDAFRIAAEQGITKINYVRGILNNNWKENGTGSKIYNNESKSYSIQRQARGSVEPSKLAESYIKLYSK